MNPAERAVAIVGLGAILPDAPDTAAFWENLQRGRYSISDVDAARWDPALYYDADPKAPEKTYSKLGGWVRDWEWNPLGWKLPIPPKVSDAMDDAQKWAVACTRMVLEDYGKPLDRERTAVILGNAMAGERHYQTSLRLWFPELARDLGGSPSFAALPADVRDAITAEWHARMEDDLPPTTEDTMPGELSNCLAGRIANLFNLRGPNYIVDAACASAMAAMDASIEGLIEHQFDAVVTGGVDRNMGVSSYIKFCAIGALSATGTRPYADGADGFVMGEGAGLFLLKRLADAERDGDRIYAVVRGMAGSSDGKGKGITAPNPIGQKLAIGRAWSNAGLSPAACSMIEGHGTSTSVGDFVELSSLGEAFAGAGLAPGSIALGSVKSNIGHLKAAAGAAGMLKATLALHHKTLPPSLGFERPNPNVDWAATPFAVNTELREWTLRNGDPRVAGVSAFGFGGTNFHAVLEEHVPGRLVNGNGRASIAVPVDVPAAVPGEVIPPAGPSTPAAKSPPRGALLIGARDAAGLAERLRAVLASGATPAPPAPEDLAAPERVCIDYGDRDELASKAQQALKAIESGNPAAWKALQGRGIFRGSGPAGKVAFLYTGQGSQYANMLAELRATEPIVAATFDEADAIMRPLLDGRALSDIIFCGPEGVAEAEAQLMRTEITQPAVLTADIALTRLLAAYGIEPDLVMGHSLGEYGALVAAGVLKFSDALEAVSARGREMAHLSVEDNGAMAAVSAPIAEVEQVVAEVDGYVVLANVNSNTQLVIGGATAAVEQAIELLLARGHRAQRLPVSHAFHTEIVAPASEPLRTMLRRLELSPPRIPVVANVSGEFYPSGSDEMVEILGRQVASPVQFVKGLHTLHAAGARVFLETGPKRALWGFAADVLGDDVMSLFTNHPKVGELPSFNQALCGLYAAGVGARAATPPQPVDEPVVITGAAVGTPGTEKVFDDGNLARLLRGEQFIDVIPARTRREIAEHHITRLVKSEDGGGAFQTIDDPEDVIKLAGRAGALDLAEEFGIEAERVAALGRETQLAIAAGIDALRDAGIPLVQHYRDTTTGSKLPDKWRLPDALRDDTGIVFASAFPGVGDFAADMNAFWSERVKRARLQELIELRERGLVAGDEIERRIADLEDELAAEPYHFDRRFLFRVLSMGHSQTAELIGARGPNTQINAACASTTQAVAVAEDWIRTGRCRRVLVVAADDVTSSTLLPWVGSGFLATGAAATDEVVEKAALPFDQRRHGTILGMGAAAIVVESAAAARERGVTPICEVLGAVTANSAFHGSRLDVEHIGGVMEAVVAQAEARGVQRAAIASQTVFVSHETFTPARGGSAAAEIHALRQVFGAAADEIVIANTKGVTGHPMGVGVEDIVAIKALETGLIPAVPNFREIDPELGSLNLSRGGFYPVHYALRLAAGFGSQISMLLLRWTAVADGEHRRPRDLGFGYRVFDEGVWTGWLRAMTGEDDPQLEVFKHQLRVVDTGPAASNGKPAAAPPRAVPVPPVPRAVPAPPAPVSLPPSLKVAPIAASPPPVATTAPAAPATPAATTPPAVPAAGDEVIEAILAIVAAQTGYPADMLDPELDLEADLGIDTVKQAEVFAAIRERYGIERDETLKLRDYPTLGHVAGFVRERAGIAPAPAVAPTAPVQTTAAPAPIEPAAGDEVIEAILAIVAAQTGYPADMLDPELDLEADLGIDTVKQAEMFAAIRAQYGIERDDTLKLRDYPTLHHVAGFVRERAAIGEPATAPADTPQAPAGDDVLDSILAIVAEQTGYPADMLDPELDLEADLGIDTVKQAEVFAAIRAQYGIERDDTLKLRDYPTLRHVAGFVHERADSGASAETAEPVPVPTAAVDDGTFPRRVPVAVVRPPLEQCEPTGIALGKGNRVIVAGDRGGVGSALTSRLRKLGVEVLAPGDGGPVDGVFWLPALDVEPPLEELDAAAWRTGLDARVKQLAMLMRDLPDTAFLITGTRLGGRHGYDAAGATSTMGGAVTGFAKALRRERSDALIKAVDFAPGRKTAEPADQLLGEALRDPGVVEIGYADGLRWTVAVIEQPLPDREATPLTPDTTFVVTGAAGSIVSAITADLATAAGGGTFHLLDLARSPEPGDADVARLGSDRDGLKLAIAERLRAAGGKPTPKLVERELARIERLAAARAAIDAIEAAGGSAHWHAVDLTEPAAVDAALAELERADVVIHAAGLDISHPLPSKPQAEYDLVFDVKADGWFNVLHALRGRPPHTVVAFASIAGRFGNAAQTDYAAANDLLCKAVSRFRRTGGPRGIAIDWTAWAEIGMATRGSIPKVMEAAGIAMLPPAVGVPAVRRELESGATGEVVIAGALGVLLEESPQPISVAKGPVRDTKATITVNGGLEIHAELDPAGLPFLDDHRIDGTPVLPGVMGMEAFAEAAAAIAPGYAIVGLEDVELQAPFKFYRDEPRALTVTALMRDAGDGRLAADCELVGRRTLAGGDEKITVHFTGRVLLAREPLPAPRTDAPPELPPGAVVEHDDVYRVYFHGPAYQVLDRAFRSNGQVCGRFAGDLPPAYAAGLGPTQVVPRLIELCFQTAGILELGLDGVMGLPTHADRVLRFDGADAPGRLTAVVTPRPDGTSIDADVVDQEGNVRIRLEGYRTTALPVAFEEHALEPLRAVARS